MSDVGRDPAPRRPASARPRQDKQDDDIAPPTAVELEAIERMHTHLPANAGADIVEDAALGVVWVALPGRGPSLNYAASVRWPAAQVEGRLESVVRRLRDRQEWPVLSIAEGLAEPPDLPARLEGAGWVRVGGERIMWNRHPPTVPHLDPGLRVEAVTQRSAHECVELETAAFGLPAERLDERADRLVSALAAGELRAFLVRLAGQPIASARLVPGAGVAAPGVAALTAINVAADHRRRGYGRLVTAVATRAGLATGHKLVWLSVDEANTAAVGVYRGLGFAPAFSWSRWAAPSR